VLVPLRFVGVPKAETRAGSLLYSPIAASMPRLWNATRGHAPTLADRFRTAIGSAASDTTGADSRTP